MAKQPRGLARATEQRQRDALERRKIEALERIATALEGLREIAVFVPYPRKDGQ